MVQASGVVRAKSSGWVGFGRIARGVAAPEPFGRCVQLHVAVGHDQLLTAGLWSVLLAKPVLHSGRAGAVMASLAGPRPSPGSVGRLDGGVVAGLILVRRGVGFEATRSALPKMGMCVCRPSVGYTKNRLRQILRIAKEWPAGGRNRDDYMWASF